MNKIFVFDEFFFGAFRTRRATLYAQYYARESSLGKKMSLRVLILPGKICSPKLTICHIFFGDFFIKCWEFLAFGPELNEHCTQSELYERLKSLQIDVQFSDISELSWVRNFNQLSTQSELYERLKALQIGVQISDVSELFW